jgi:ferredoxin
MTDTTGLPELTADGRARAAALARLGHREVTPAAIVEFVSRGRVLIVGDEQQALAAARRLGAGLTCVVAAPSDELPFAANAGGTPVVRGGRPMVRGALGDFKAWFPAAGEGSDLGALLSPPVERFDLVVDLEPAPLLRRAMLPLGYYAPGPDGAALEQVLAALPDMQGEFVKPRFFEYDAEICAHGRSGKRGCTRCIDACPAEAIASAGERIRVDPYLCQGGGACATACPTGAITYAYPPASDLLDSLREALHDYRAAGGAAPVLLFHDESSAAALKGLLATLPERVLPVQVEEVGSVGLDAWLAGLAYGAEAVVVLTSDRTPQQVVETAQDQLLTARAILAGMGYEDRCVQMLNADLTAATLDALAALPHAAPRRPAVFAGAADKRGRLRLALQHLHAQAPAPRRSVALPAGAPFGEVRVETQGCTLCMSCVSVCPTHALQDGRGLPQLNFREWGCVQCGLCEKACPEQVITLHPRLLYDIEARERPRVLHEEQPVCCISCGKLFTTRSMLEVVGRKLEGHWMFQTEEARRRLQLCEDCRVRDLFTAPGRNDRS